MKIAKTKTGMHINLLVPEGSDAVVYIPKEEQTVIINGRKIKSNKIEGSHRLFTLKGGEYKIVYM